MKKIIVIMMGLVFILSLSCNGFANGLATATGEIETVGSDGPFDAKKNPAVISLEKEKNAAGIFINGGQSKTSYDYEESDLVDFDYNESESGIPNIKEFFCWQKIYTQYLL